MSILEIRLTLHMMIQPCVLSKGKTLTIFMTTSWKTWTPHAAGRWFSPDTPFSSTNKIDSHDRTEILLTVALSTIALVIALTITIIFLNVNVLLLQLFSFYFLLNWYFVRMINFACSYSILSRNNVSISGPFALITHSPWVR